MSGIDPIFSKEYDDFLSKTFSQCKEKQSPSFVFNPYHSFPIDDQRKRFRIYKYKEKILSCLENYQTLILVAESDSGKSTQIPQYLYECGWHLKGQVGVIESSKLSAINLAERVSLEMGEVLGQSVDAVVSGNEKICRHAIKFMTHKIFLKEILNDPLLTRYSVIILDDAHDCSYLADIILGLMKKILRQRLTLKIIICSASKNAEFLKTFMKKNNKLESSSVTILSVGTSLHPVEIYYLNIPCSNYVDSVVKTVWKIHKQELTGDVLAFLTGQEDVIEAHQLLIKYIIAHDDKTIQSVPFFGSLSNNDQLQAFFRQAKGIRKVVFSTNIAESSLAIPGIVYVVDCGFVKLRWYNYKCGSENISTVPVSKSTALQRSIRAGMERRGKAFRLYTEEHYELLIEETTPEMCRIDLSFMVIYLKSIGVINILRFDFPSPPPAKNLLCAIESLYALDIIDDVGQLKQPIGYFLSEFPLGPMMGKMLYMSGSIGCSEEILSIVAMLHSQPIFVQPTSGIAQIKLRIARRNFEVHEGDLLTLLNIFTAFVNLGRTKDFCRRHFLSHRSLNNAYELRNKLAYLVGRKYEVPLISCNGNIDSICKCITAGFFQNTAYLHHSGEYRTLRGNIELFVHPLSTLRSLHKPNFVIYCKLIQTNKLYMKDITEIKEEWLNEFASHYYNK